LTQHLRSGYLKYPEFASLEHVRHRFYVDLICRNRNARSLYPWSAFSVLFQFFIKPHFRIFLDFEDNWKEPCTVTLGDKKEARACKVRFLEVAVSNDGRSVANDCRAQVHMVNPKLMVATRHVGIRWEKALAQTVFDVADLPDSITQHFLEKTDIEAGRGLPAIILFATEYDKEAHFATDRPTSVAIPSVTDVTLRVVGSNFVAKYLGRFRIMIRSWHEIDISEVTLGTQVSDALRALAKHFRK